MQLLWRSVLSGPYSKPWLGNRTRGLQVGMACNGVEHLSSNQCCQYSNDIKKWFVWLVRKGIMHFSNNIKITIIIISNQIPITYHFEPIGQGNCKARKKAFSFIPWPSLSSLNALNYDLTRPSQSQPDSIENQPSFRSRIDHWGANTENEGSKNKGQ